MHSAKKDARLLAAWALVTDSAHALLLCPHGSEALSAAPAHKLSSLHETLLSPAEARLI